MTASVPTESGACFDSRGEKEIFELVAARDVVALGPGLGRARETGTLVRRLVAAIDRPLVVDADGLFALHGHLESLRDRADPTVLTPHPGEAAHLLDCDAAIVNANRLGAARTLAARSGAVVVLKGAGTIIADREGNALIVPTGGPVLASGGTGDVLTGIVAALLAARLPAFEAAGLAAWWHGAAADARSTGGVAFGLLASELADALAGTAAALQSRVANRMAGDERGEGEGLALRFPGT
jgi:NAD(P)H-hydrate epimerase